MKKFYYFNFHTNDENKSIINFLKTHQVKYTINRYEHTVNYDSISIEISDDMLMFSEIFELFYDHNIKYTNSWIEYSKQELFEAKWLTVRSQYRLGYPQPENHYEEMVYDFQEGCNLCGKGRVQKECFQINKLPNWKNRNFYQPYWLEDVLFCSLDIRKILIENQVTGMQFKNVLQYKKKNILSDVFQIDIQNTLQNGFKINSEDIKELNVCTNCGTNQYKIENTAIKRMTKESLENAKDFNYTSEIFGRFYRDIIISNKVYQLLKNSNLDRGLLFDVVCEV